MASHVEYNKAPQTQVRPGKASKIVRQLLAQRYLQVMALLGLAWMIIFNFIPLFGSIVAFKEYDIIASVAKAPWVGLDHFREFFSDDQLPGVIRNTLGISLLKLILFPVPILFALFLNEIRSLPFKRVVQTISYLPHFLSWIILGGILTTWLSDVGVINKLFLALGLIHEPISYLAEPKYFWTIVVTSDLWKELGWSAIIYFAAMAGVSPEMYEAATIDGAGRFQKMRYVTLPSIAGTISILFILGVSSILTNNFDQIFVLHNSLNDSASNVIDTFVYQTGISQSRYSYATAVGLIKQMISFGLLLLANGVLKRLNQSTLF